MEIEQIDPLRKGISAVESSSTAKSGRNPRRVIILAILAAVYLLAGKVGLHFAIISPSAAAVWAPSGIALGACLLWGMWVWPAIFVGAFLVNLTTAGTVATSLGIACGNTGEALLGAYLVTRFANGRDVFMRTHDAFKFLILAAVLSTTLAATVGVTTLCAAGFNRWSEYPWIWLTWWLGDAAGDLLIAPLILLWGTNPRFDNWRRAQTFEAVLLLSFLILTGGVVFGGWLPLPSQRYPLDFLCVPVLLWAAFRFGPRETATVNFLSSSIAVVGTLNGFGPFARGDQNQALLLLQSFAGLTQIMAIAVATEIVQRRTLDNTQRLARESAEAANRAKDEFLAMLGHELRNPLHAIALAMHLLGDDRTGGNAVTTSARTIIARNIEHLTRLVDDLLDVSRVTTGKIVLASRPMNLGECVSGCVGALRETRQLANRKLEIDLDPVWIEGDIDRITQIVTNLLGNAIKYTTDGATIEVSVKAEADDAVIRVRDTGIGIPADLLPRIFDLFARGDDGLARFPGGLGIGLTLVQRLVALHGGSVTALSDGKDQGSTFVVRLPRLAAPLILEIETPALSAAGVPQRILIVEDNADARASLCKLLEQWQHEVHEAADGPSGVEVAIRVRPDLALIDIGLPGFDGYEVARRIRADLAGSEITLVAVTGYALREHRSKAEQAGFDDYLVKPVDATRLAQWFTAHPPSTKCRAA